MNTKLNVFTNNNITNFLEHFLFEYELNFKKLKDISLNLQGAYGIIIILNNEKDLSSINLKKINENCLLITNLKIKNLNFYKNIKLLSTPLSIIQIKDSITNYMQNLKFQFHDICIHNEKLTNTKNKTFCYLTKIEQDILSHIIKEKETSKIFIKENILNIKSSIETNSLESHLSRIRKKMNKVKTIVKIQTKSEKLIITT